MSCPVWILKRGARAALVILLPAGVFASPVVAQDRPPGMVQMGAAEKHAGLAAAATRLSDVRHHLQQSLNCLEGGGGPGNRAAAGTCAGAGAVQRLPASSVNRIRVRKAIHLASVGVTFHDFEPAHHTAQAVQAVLQEGTR
jgi:hypothetical protein